MDNVNDNGNRPAPQQGADIDWYSFNQDKPVSRAGDQTKPQAPSNGPDDPYGYNQGKPGHEKPGDTNCHKHEQRLTLYDVAVHELKKSHTDIKCQDDVYRKLNEMMVAHGHEKANIDGRTGINDHMLPKSWNNVDPRTLETVHHQHKPAHHCPEEQHKPHPHPKPEPAPERPAPERHAPPAERPAPAPRPEGYDQPPPPPPPAERPYQDQTQYRQPYYHQNDGGQVLANVVGGLIGGFGASMLFGGGYHHHGFYRQPMYNYNQPNYYDSGYYQQPNYYYQQQYQTPIPIPFFAGRHHRW